MTPLQQALADLASWADYLSKMEGLDPARVWHGIQVRANTVMLAAAREINPPTTPDMP